MTPLHFATPNMWHCRSVHPRTETLAAWVWQVEWANPEDPTKGFKYLFLSEEDYTRITSKYPAALVAEAVTEGGK